MVAAIAVVGILLASPPLGAGASPAAAGPPPTSAGDGVRRIAPNGRVAVASRTKLLGPDWQRSRDLAWTVRGDASGLHVLVARKSEGYGWSTLATLGDSSIETDRWIGNACLSGSGTRLFVVYAPRTFTNDETLTTRGGFTAVVDMATGRVRTLPEHASLAYFSPGCGTGETAVFTQEGAEGGARKTRLLTVDGVRGRVTTTRVVKGQVTSAVPYGNGFAAVRGSAVLAFRPGAKPRTLATSAGRISRVSPLPDGSIVFMDTTATRSRVSRLARGRTTALAKAPVGRIDVRRTPLTGGAVITGTEVTALRPMPAPVSTWAVKAGSVVSSAGEAAVTKALSALDRTVATAAATPAASSPDLDASLRVATTVAVRDTGKTLRGRVGTSGSVSRAARTGSRAAAPLLARPAGTATATVEAERSCSIPRNDPTQQIYQPTPRQVEWAVDQAVQNNLKMTRPAGWKDSHTTASWTPQGMFPLPTLTGGTTIPAPLVLGVFAQESNLWQASNHAVYGQTGNPLVGNYYGRPIYDASSANDWDVVWDDADCGYGISQMTDGMVLAGREQPGQVAALPINQQRAIAHDYASNIAAGVRLLAQKWNEVSAAGLTINNGDSTKLENWFYAVWAYNTGFHAQGADPDGAWGLGWLNNPANPRYDENRWTFLDANSGGSPADAADPARWPYPEKVLGFASQSLGVPEYDYKNASGVVVHDTYGVAFTGVAWWNDVYARTAQKPPLLTFCDSRNSCGMASGASEATCSFVGSKCWVHYSATWKSDCSYSCGNGYSRFNTTYPEQGDGWAYPPHCSLSDLPAGALVIDDVAASGVTPQASFYGCTRAAASAGTFGFTFASDSAGLFPSKVDTHQIGGGFNGHFWFAHTRSQTANPALGVTGKWTFTTAVNGWGRVLVHMPDHGAHTSEASYQIYRGAGTLQGGTRTKTRVAAQRIGRNGWVSLGVLQFAGKPNIKLSNLTKYGVGDNDIAWDAVAIVPLSKKPTKFVVALGDSYSSGEAGVNDESDYFHETNVDGSNPLRRNACHRSRFAWSRRAVLAGNLNESIGSREDRWDPTLDYHLIACSGAQTENILSASRAATNEWGQKGQREGQAANSLPQLDQGYLDENTTLVTMSIGGNDARFGPIMAVCDNPVHNPLTSCQDTTLDGDSGPLTTAEPSIIQTDVRLSIETTLAEIHHFAPNAKIVLMGYPRLIQDGSCTVDVTMAEVNWISDMTDVMRDQMALAAQHATAAGAPTTFADPIGDFAGRGACAPDAAITDEVLSRTEGDEPFGTSSPVSQQSFHPNYDGTGLYADALNRALRSIGQ
ncbi:SGNH/GDSL hydrolase family protein [Nocardioides sp.]|uniref:SGNH/GDSL hydrolase family protein n=1 Tax=Nocardioides sp. TaxID=35761 RepID=UPI0035273360